MRQGELPQQATKSTRGTSVRTIRHKGSMLLKNNPKTRELQEMEHIEGKRIHLPVGGILWKRGKGKSTSK